GWAWALPLAPAAAWLAVLGTVYAEQAADFVRTAAETYTSEHALGRVKPVRWFTVELFNPSFQRARFAQEPRDRWNPVHSARYLGASLVPLLVAAGLFRWRRLERGLGASAGGVLAVCLAPPFLLTAGELTPLMNR